MSFITNLKHVTVGDPMVIIQIQDFDFLALNIAANKLLSPKEVARLNREKKKKQRKPNKAIMHCRDN